MTTRAARHVAFQRIMWIAPCIVLALASRAEDLASATLIVRVRNGVTPVIGAHVTAGGSSAESDTKGEATFTLPQGEVEISILHPGFLPSSLKTSVAAGSATTTIVQLAAQIFEAEVTVVSATRSGTIVGDQPIRVEAIPEEEIEENLTIAPGNLSTLLEELGGIRVQSASPGLGGAGLRVQGLRGRYSQILADELPLYGGEPDAFSLMQVPPLDLARVEVIKGTTSAFYGGSALGGVLNLVSRRPGTEPEALLNVTSNGGSDALGFASARLSDHWGATLLASANYQSEEDLDDDGWADLAGYRRGVLRPRVFWNDDDGRSFFATLGAMEEKREGGTVDDAKAPDGNPFQERLDTGRYDGGMSGHMLIDGLYLLSARASFQTTDRERLFGETRENEDRRSGFGEFSISGSAHGHTWLVGAALQHDDLELRERGDLGYSYTVPAIFAQDEIAFSSRFSAAASGRIDLHDEYGTFFSPRISLLFRPRADTSIRLSGGTGFAVPSPFNERTETVGLSPLLPYQDLEPERARSISLDAGWASGGLELNGTVFASRVHHALLARDSVELPGRIEIVNAPEPTETYGTELLVRYVRGPLQLIATHTFVDATESDPAGAGRRDVPLTPRHAAELAAIVESEERGRIGAELSYTGTQSLEENPYRETSESYLELSILGELRFGETRIYVNAMNLTDVRQTDYDPLYLPEQAADGRWTTDAWAPLEGRSFNAGVRLEF